MSESPSIPPKPSGPLISVLMPVYNRARFIPRAIESLLAQTYKSWELIIVDDGSKDDTAVVVAPYLGEQVSYHRLEKNSGMGSALNAALAAASGTYIAYLPSDDVYYSGHLTSLYERLERDHEAVLAFSGIRHHGHDYTTGQVDGFPLQLVQVLHRRATDLQWLTRNELVTDDLETMFWHALRSRGTFVESGEITSEWVDHPSQRHRIIRESLGGGLNRYRREFGITEPLRFQSSEGDLLDEAELYRQLPPSDVPTHGNRPLRILIVGELAFNADRVLALQEAGHTLFGLWTPDGVGYNTVGPLPFGDITEVPLEGWEESVDRIRPDVIYALLNWQAVPFAHRVLLRTRPMPFVWHFKESPFACIERGTWPQLAELHLLSDGQIYTSPEMMDWYEGVLGRRFKPETSIVLDGDLPKRDWMTDDWQPRLSETDGGIHTAIVGRPFGIHPETMKELAGAGIHMHFYGPTYGPWWAWWISETRKVADGYLHIHPSVLPPDWVRELSKYDAGWLHMFQSRNGGDLRRANWDDMNYPARIGTLAAAGLPFIQPEHRPAVVATERLARRLDIGLSFRDVAHLRDQLLDEERMSVIRANVRAHREEFSFDFHVERLVDFFRQAIAPDDGRLGGTISHRRLD